MANRLRSRNPSCISFPAVLDIVNRLVGRGGLLKLRQRSQYFLTVFARIHVQKLLHNDAFRVAQESVPSG